MRSAYRLPNSCKTVAQAWVHTGTVPVLDDPFPHGRPGDFVWRLQAGAGLASLGR